MPLNADQKPDPFIESVQQVIHDILMPKHPVCKNGCQYAKDIGAEPASCSGKCMYLGLPDEPEEWP